MSKFKVGNLVIVKWEDAPATTGEIESLSDSLGEDAYIVLGSDGSRYYVEEDQLLARGGEVVNPSEPDMVDRPNHYTAGMPEGVEVIDIINAQGAGYLHGNVLKYVLRWKFKNGLEDLKKARVYLNWLIEKVEAGDEG